MDHAYRDAQRAAAARWKSATALLPPEARLAAPYVDVRGHATSASLPYCLPPDLAVHNLLPQVRLAALALFAELGIPWHAGVGDGPGNHLLSSQVQCANALTPMASDPDRVVRAFGGVLDIGEVLEIEPGRHLTFEYIGPVDYFHEGAGHPRTRGARCTSVDAAFRYRTTEGRTELALVGWKYVEEYRTPVPRDPGRDLTRARRYGSLWAADDGPLRSDLLSFDDVLAEPFSQLVRQQLLAHQLEADRILDAEAVRVVHVHPQANHAYQDSLTLDAHHDLGSTVEEVWGRLLRRPDRYVVLPSEAFLDARTTHDEYVERYAGMGTLSPLAPPPGSADRTA